MGYGLAYPPSVIAVSYRFDKRLGLANGIVSSGIGFGILVMAPVIETLCEEYGWQGALLVHSAITAHRIAFALLMTPSAREKRALRQNRRRMKLHHHADSGVNLCEEATYTERTEVDRETSERNVYIDGETSRYTSRQLDDETNLVAKNEEEDSELTGGGVVTVTETSVYSQLGQLHSESTEVAKNKENAVIHKNIYTKIEVDEEDGSCIEEESTSVRDSQSRDDACIKVLGNGEEENSGKEISLGGQRKIENDEERTKSDTDMSQEEEETANRCLPEMQEGHDCRQLDKDVEVKRGHIGCTFNTKGSEDCNVGGIAENENKSQHLTSGGGDEDRKATNRDGRGYDVGEKGLGTNDLKKAKQFDSPCTCLGCKQILRLLNETFDFTYLLSIPSFSILLVVVFAITMSCIPFRYYIPSKLVYDLGISRIDASVAVTVFGACMTVSRALHGLLLDFGIISLPNLFLLCASLSAVSLLVNPATDAFAGQLVTAAVVGLCDGVTLPIMNLFAKELVEPAKLPNAFGFHYALGGVGMMIGIQLMG